MKKFMVLALSLVLGACVSNCPRSSGWQGGCRRGHQAMQTHIQVQQETMMVDPCKCNYKPSPNREVLRPRIKQVVIEQPRRNCPPDMQQINCGCGNCATFNNTYRHAIITPAMNTQNYVVEESESIHEIVPAIPEAYILASNRVFNRFIRDTYDIYSQNPNTTLYVKRVRGHSKDLPGGVGKGKDNFKKQVEKSYTFNVSNDSAADYYVETTVDWLDTPSKKVPAIQYKVTLFDKNNKKIQEWVEVLKKADDSDTWL